MDHIHYKDGYKYQLHEDYALATDLQFLKTIETEYITLTKEGWLFCHRGYAWDGPSGPTFDTLTFMRGSLVHDALYQLIRLEKIDRSYKEYADQLLHDLCVADGMARWRAWYVRLAVKKFGKMSAHPNHKKKVLVAP